MALAMVREYSSRIDADVARLALEAEGIPAILFDAGAPLNGVRFAFLDEDGVPGASPAAQNAGGCLRFFHSEHSLPRALTGAYLQIHDTPPCSDRLGRIYPAVVFYARAE